LVAKSLFSTISFEIAISRSVCAKVLTVLTVSARALRDLPSSK
jgi:hypothetical protein